MTSELCDLERNKNQSLRVFTLTFNPIMSDSFFFAPWFYFLNRDMGFTRFCCNFSTIQTRISSSLRDLVSLTQWFYSNKWRRSCTTYNKGSVCAEPLAKPNSLPSRFVDLICGKLTVSRGVHFQTKYTSCLCPVFPNTTCSVWFLETDFFDYWFFCLLLHLLLLWRFVWHIVSWCGSSDGNLHRISADLHVGVFVETLDNCSCWVKTGGELEMSNARPSGTDEVLRQWSYGFCWTLCEVWFNYMN